MRGVCLLDILEGGSLGGLLVVVASLDSRWVDSWCRRVSLEWWCSDSRFVVSLVALLVDSRDSLFSLDFEFRFFFFFLLRFLCASSE